MRGLIIGSIQGAFNSAIVEKMAADLAEMSRRHGYTRLLNYLREAKITPDAFDIYQMPRTVGQVRVPDIFKRALFVNPPLVDCLFLETVSVNVGQTVKVFTDPEAAAKWLTEVDKFRAVPETGGE